MSEKTKQFFTMIGISELIFASPGISGLFGDGRQGAVYPLLAVGQFTPESLYNKKKSGTLYCNGRAFAAADAYRCYAAFQVVFLKRIEQGNDDAGP